MKDILHIIEQDQLLKIVVALVLGAVLGFEREYKRKAAGIRTMTLICVSSTLFTILSAELGYPASADRVASNILTGVGFIGAGVIFKGDFTIDGITTAATIWIAAALGMAVGMSHYWLATFTLMVSLLTLLGMEQIEFLISRRNDKRTYTIIYYMDQLPAGLLDAKFHELGLKSKKVLSMRRETLIEDKYEVRGRLRSIAQFNDYLLQHPHIREFEVLTNPL